MTKLAEPRSRSRELFFNALAWWWQRTQAAWIAAWYEPRRSERVAFLVIAVIGFWFVGIHARGAGIGILLSYVLSSVLVWSQATPFRIVKGIPLPIGAPFYVLGGVILSSALRPVISEGMGTAFGGDLGASVILFGVVALLTNVANRLKKGEPLYE